MQRDVSAKIRERIEKKMERVRRRLADLPSAEELMRQIRDVEVALAQVEAQLDAEFELGSESTSGALAQLEGQREKLLAQMERLDLRQELITEKRERMQGTLEDLRASMLQSERDYVVPSIARYGAEKLKEERRQILEMVQIGKITADEAARLLEALRGQIGDEQKRRRKPRWVRIRVTDTSAGRVNVNLTLPVGVVRAGLRAGGSIAGMEGLDTSKLEDMLNRGETGHILDMQDIDDGERVEVFIE